MRKTRITKVESLHKRTASALPVAEDTMLAVKVFGGNCYDMILCASLRAYEITRGSPPLIKEKHKPTVTAILEIQQGLVTKDRYLR